MKSQIQAKILVEIFFKEYLVNRNYHNLTSLLDKKITWFGTGKDEVCDGFEEAAELVKKDFSQIETLFNITRQKLKEEKITKDISVVWGILSAETYFGGERLGFEDVRVTVVCKKQEKSIKIIHVHISLPSENQKEDEFYPIIELRDYVEKLSEIDSLNNIDDLSKAYLEMKRHYLELLETNKRLNDINIKLKNHIKIDGLTGLLNHTYIMKKLEEELARCSHCGVPLVLLMLDLDYFKKVNDTYGHMVGDEVLMKSSQLLQDIVGDLGGVGRYGGEEFCIVLPEIGLEKGLEISEEIRKSFEAHSFSTEKIKVTISIGISEANGHIDKQKLIEETDELLYDAKNTGRNKVCVGGK
ncbi:MAG: diguanylate cyclase [Cellulosilyticaceae bacterium]